MRKVKCLLLSVAPKPRGSPGQSAGMKLGPWLSHRTMALCEGKLSQTSYYCTEYVGSLRYRKVRWALPKVPHLSLCGRKELHFGKAGAAQFCLKRLGLEVTHPRFAKAGDTPSK
jgi:hypothetical protein